LPNRQPTDIGLAMARQTMSSYHSAVSKAMIAAMEIGEASAITIGLRMPLLMSMPFWPQMDVLLEAHRMVTEKVVAATEGTIAASQAGAVLATRAALGRIHPSDVAAGMVTVAMAAATPVRRRARANARRLSRG
jgi:hypothetical protein